MQVVSKPEITETPIVSTLIEVKNCQVFNGEYYTLDRLLAVSPNTNKDGFDRLDIIVIRWHYAPDECEPIIELTIEEGIATNPPVWYELKPYTIPIGFIKVSNLFTCITNDDIIVYDIESQGE